MKVDFAPSAPALSGYPVPSGFRRRNTTPFGDLGQLAAWTNSQSVRQPAARISVLRRGWFQFKLGELVMHADNRADLPPSTWDPALNAVIAEPKHHKVLFENEGLRVLEVTLELV